MSNKSLLKCQYIVVLVCAVRVHHTAIEGDVGSENNLKNVK